ncbi:hypothetical protein ACJ41O_013627 [Fusarium nematophilum]
MPSSRIIKAVLVAAFALSGADAGLCRLSSSSIATTTAGISTDATSGTATAGSTGTASGTSTAEATLTSETTGATTDTASLSTTDTTTVEIASSTATTTTAAATTTAAVCTLSTDETLLESEVCGRHGTLGSTLPELTHVEEGLTFQECGDLANHYDGFDGYVNAGSFVFTADNRCVLFAGRAESDDAEAAFTVDQGGNDLQYNFNCFECPYKDAYNGLDLRCSIRAQPERRLRRRTPTPDVDVCGVQGQFQNTDAQPVYSFGDLNAVFIAEQCAQKCDDHAAECETFVVVDGERCDLYSLTTEELEFVETNNGQMDFMVYQKSCAVCEDTRT